MPKKTRRKFRPNEPRRLTNVCKSPTPATMPEAPPTQPARLDPFDALRASKPRLATRAEIQALAERWRR